MDTKRQINRMSGKREADVAIMLHDLAVTGVARNALAIAQAARQAGLRTEIWVVDDAGPLVGQVPEGVELVRLGNPKWIWGNRRLADIAAIGAFAKALHQRRPAIAFSAGNHFHITASAGYFLAGSPPSVKLLFRASNPPFQARKMHIGVFLAWLYRLRFRGAYRIVAVSEELRNMLVKDSGLAPDRVVTIANSIDLGTAKELAGQALEHPWFVPGEPPVILGIGRLAPQKNFGLLISAFARVRQTRPVRLAIIGDGAGAERAKLEALTADLGLTPDDIWFAGRQANPLRFLARAGLFVLSSNWEGMSNVLLEAMACGCPIVATDCPAGVRELLDGGRIGPIVPMKDLEELSNAMSRRLEEPRGSEGLIEHVARFDRDRMLAAYANLLKSEVGDGATV